MKLTKTQVEMAARIRGNIYPHKTDEFLVLVEYRNCLYTCHAMLTGMINDCVDLYGTGPDEEVLYELITFFRVKRSDRVPLPLTYREAYEKRKKIILADLESLERQFFPENFDEVNR